MSFFQLVSTIAKAKFAQSNIQPKKYTPTPLNLCQDSMVEISSVPIILANSEGSLVPEITGKNIISGVGTLSIAGLSLYRSYLSNCDGAFIQTATKNQSDLTAIETRLYVPYAELFPTDSEDPNDFMSWKFWLDTKEGYIGAPIMQGKNEDGAHQYSRSFSPASSYRIQPITTTETISDAQGNSTAYLHSLMQYERVLNETIKEYLLVSAVASENIASVSMWLGLDLSPSDLSVYSASNA